MSTFEELNKVDVSEHTEKKGQFTYLSWPFAVEELGKADPEATWDVHLFDGAPYMKTDCGYFVQVTVYVNGIPKTQIHPVLDNRNKPIAEPNAFQINTSIQRCLVKAIALHGLGLYIYAGEDLPHDKADPDPKVIEVLELAASHGTDAFRAAWKKVAKAQRDLIPPEMTAIWKEVASESDRHTEADNKE